MGWRGGDPAGGSTTSADGSKDDDAFSLLHLVVFAACVIVVVVVISMATGQFSRWAGGAATPQTGTYTPSPDYGSMARR